MGINIFIIAIIVISIAVTNIKVEHKVHKNQYTHIPMVTFENLKMYDLDDKHITKIVQARQALNYKDMDELYDATVIIRDKDTGTDSISAEYMVKTANIYKLYQGVNIIQNEQIQLITNFLVYDERKQIATNNTEFTLTYNDSQLTGDHIYFDAINGVVKAKNTQFNIKDYR